MLGLPASPRLLGLSAFVDTGASLRITLGSPSQGAGGCLGLALPQPGARAVRGKLSLLLSLGSSGTDRLVLGPHSLRGAVGSARWPCSWLVYSCFQKETNVRACPDLGIELGSHSLEGPGALRSSAFLGTTYPPTVRPFQAPLTHFSEFSFTFFPSLPPSPSSPGFLS